MTSVQEAPVLRPQALYVETLTGDVFTRTAVVVVMMVDRVGVVWRAGDKLAAAIVNPNCMENSEGDRVHVESGVSDHAGTNHNTMAIVACSAKSELWVFPMVVLMVAKVALGVA